MPERAEGVESDEQARFLAQHGSPAMQGYLFHRPASLERVIGQLSGPLSGPLSRAA